MQAQRTTERPKAEARDAEAAHEALRRPVLRRPAHPPGLGELRPGEVRPRRDYDDFISDATRGRDYQREAIETTLRFLAGGRYENTEELARESYADSPDLQRRYANADALVERLPFPDKLACSLDLATGTGKSFVYVRRRADHAQRGARRPRARALPVADDRGRAEGEVQRADRRLRPDRPAARPAGGHPTPDVVDAGSTVKEEQICIENIHADLRAHRLLDHATRSPARASGRSSSPTRRITSTRRGETKLKQLEASSSTNPDYGFRYHLGVSGTCYVGNEYFADVVYRYSIRDAINDRWVKEVFYLAKDDSATDDERFQKLLAQHEKNRKTYKPLKPLTIAVTQEHQGRRGARRGPRSRSSPSSLKGSRDEAEAQGPRRHLVRQARGRTCSSCRPSTPSTNPVEWIVSVSMLTEGWDVKNVFQIYPHEKRAFNSKLLISQVLGRGPAPARGLAGQPLVYVFNHQKWGAEIEELVAEVLDRRRRSPSGRPTARPVPHFELHDLELQGGADRHRGARRSRSRRSIGDTSTCARSATHDEKTDVRLRRPTQAQGRRADDARDREALPGRARSSRTCASGCSPTTRPPAATWPRPTRRSASRS